MTIDDFAKGFKFNGVHVFLDAAAKRFATEWGNIVLADYLISAGIHNIQTGRKLVGIRTDTPEPAPAESSPAQQL
jgi:hypothetical protein